MSSNTELMTDFAKKLGEIGVTPDNYQQIFDVIKQSQDERKKKVEDSTRIVASWFNENQKKEECEKFFDNATNNGNNEPFLFQLSVTASVIDDFKQKEKKSTESYQEINKKYQEALAIIEAQKPLLAQQTTTVAASAVPKLTPSEMTQPKTIAELTKYYENEHQQTMKRLRMEHNNFQPPSEGV